MFLSTAQFSPKDPRIAEATSSLFVRLDGAMGIVDVPTVRMSSDGMPYFAYRNNGEFLFSMGCFIQFVFTV